MVNPVLSVGRYRCWMVREELVCRCYSCVVVKVSLDVMCESGECFVFIRVRSRKVAVRAARLGCLAIQDGAKLVAGVACVLRGPALSVPSSLQRTQRGLTCEAT